MLRRFKPVVFLALILCLIAVEVSGLSAQSASRARERLEQFKKLKLIETLDLDDKTAEKFFVVYNNGSNKVEQTKEELDAALTDLYQALEADAGEAQIKVKTDFALVKHEATLKAVSEMMTSVRKVLSPDQFARYIIFEARFHKEVRRQIMEMSERRREGRDSRTGRDSDFSGRDDRDDNDRHDRRR